MKNNKVVLTIFGALLAALWSAQAAAGVIGYVELKLERLTENGWRGGGRAEFKIEGYSGVDSPVLGESNTMLYASCIESTENINIGNKRWYQITESIIEAPSSGHIDHDEASLIERVLSQKFGVDFLQTTGSFDYDAMATLQSLLWDAAKYDGLPGAASNDWGKQSAVNTLIGSLDVNAPIRVDSFALIHVNKTADGWTNGGGQDFIVYQRGPDNTTDVPVPAPLLLFGTGLLGLYGVLRRRRA